MTQYILDTDTLSLLQHGHPKVLQEFGARSPSEVAITVISLEDRRAHARNAEALRHVEDGADVFPIRAGGHGLAQAGAPTTAHAPPAREPRQLAVKISRHLLPKVTEQAVSARGCCATREVSNN